MEVECSAAHKDYRSNLFKKLSSIFPSAVRFKLELFSSKARGGQKTRRKAPLARPSFPFFFLLRHLSLYMKTDYKVFHPFSFAPLPLRHSFLSLIFIYAHTIMKKCSGGRFFAPLCLSKCKFMAEKIHDNERGFRVSFAFFFFDLFMFFQDEGGKVFRSRFASYRFCC